ncbi:uncharacterized protein BYT42DRAFT_569983 [Radiomyces spectabilis]|uniref:uncharacterized protein n=1 Tax=Radiomyces spectabilis TaxID=64574 RepID=UPI0022205D07|nr:uncharacterized protein BYT42DRAFT_569983 [Radiomyces spectabilis]KAI8379774.1 hypothetical protein BYT42DRAFT_569983 [Radiomyces spectabilis]
MFPIGRMGEKSNYSPTVAIIGSGFSGICAAIQLKKNFGIDAQLYEASSDIGGTWHANTYPGCACDVPSHLYSLSFELNPNWSQKYSGQAEIHSYLQGIAKKYGLYDHTLLQTKVVQITWLSDINQWRLEYRHLMDDEKENHVAYYDIVFAGLGPLRVPHIPEEYKGFQGTIVHTTQWDSNVDFNNKRVAIIGNGASAIQVIPEIAKVASTLYSYQRTPTWLVPKGQYRYWGWVKKLFSMVPLLMKFHRLTLFLVQECMFPSFKKENSWIARLTRRILAWDMRRRLVKQGRADLVPLLIPSYPVGCKRIVRTDDYLETLSRKNVVVKMGHITDVHGRTIAHEDGSEQEVDILILATGFDVAGSLASVKVYGRNNVQLNKLWSMSIPKTFATTSIHNFPNFFMMLGPNSGLGHNSVVLMIEGQVNHAMKCIRYMKDHNLQALEAKQDSQEAFAKKMAKELKGTVWAGNCTSFYKTKSGIITGLWPRNVMSFWSYLSAIDIAKNYIHYQKTN